MNEDVRAQKDALENLNTRKSTSRRILTGILSKNSELKPNLSSKRSRECRSSRSIRLRINMSKIQDCQHNSSPMILIGNQMVYSSNQGIISLAFCPNYKDLDKTRVKLFPNFTRHHLITHTNLSVQNVVQGAGLSLNSNSNTNSLYTRNSIVTLFRTYVHGVEIG